MSSISNHDRTTFLYTFSIAVALNYVWEILQAPLYLGMGPWNQRLWHCYIASLGDGTIVLLICLLGWLFFQEPTWYINAGLKEYSVMLFVGAGSAIVIEKIALGLGRWEYSSQMPIIPILNIGLVPVLQMLVLPPIIFWTVRKLTS